MINETFLGVVKKFNGSNENPANVDTNGYMPVIIVPVAGKCPSKRVLAGTIAFNEGLNVNSTYLFTVAEQEPDEEYGRQFNFTAVKEATLMEIIQAKQFIGSPVVIDVMDSEEDTTENNTSEENAQPANKDNVEITS